MTITKMIKILSEFEDRPVFQIQDADKYDFDNDKWLLPVREVVKISDILIEFRNKSGEFFETYRFTTSFHELVEIIKSGKEDNVIKRHYEDSAEEFQNQWRRLHPDGETYEAYVKRKFEERQKKLENQWRNLATVSNKFYKPGLC